MYHIKIFLILFIFNTCLTFSQATPSLMFIDLYEKYKNTDYKNNILSQNGEGSVIRIFDINNKLSENLFCRINMYSSLGQTQYLIYHNLSDDIWYFHKKAFFYKVPFELENAEILNTYFKYEKTVSNVFNDITGKYDIYADTNKYRAITDVSSLMQLIEIINNAIE